MAVNHEDLTANHIPHTGTYATAAARLAASGFDAGDVGKLYVQTDGRRKLWRLAATTPLWDALVPTGKNVIFVDPKGEGDYALLSDAFTAISDAADAAADNQYLVIVNGIVEEAAEIAAPSFVNVQGLAGASLQVTPASAGPAVMFTSVTYAVWKDLDIQALGGNAERAVELAGCDNTVKLVNLTTSTASATHKAIEITAGTADLKLNSGVPEGDYIADAGEPWGVGRPGEARTFAAILTGSTSGAATTELLKPDGLRLVLPNLCTWVFDGWVVGRNADGAGENAGYKIAGVIYRDATAGTTALQGSVTKTVLGEAESDYDVTVTADATNGALKIECTGATGDSMRWLATVIISQILTVIT